MKIKTDFITNSSSSSFVIMSKENLNEHQLKEEIMKALNLSSFENTLLPNLGKDIANVLTSNLTFGDIAGYLYDMGYDDVSELKESMSNHGGKVYENYKEYPFIMLGFVTNESDDGIELMLVDTNIDFKNDKIIILKNGGY